MLGTPKGLSDEKAARMMAALREGRTLWSFSVMAPRLEAYFAANPGYAQEARPLIEANARAARQRKGSLRSTLTHCKYGHPFSGENLYLAPGRKERKCLACLKRRGERARRVSEQQARRVVEALNEGKTISNITKTGQSYIVNHRALLLFRQKHPTFDRFVVRRSAANAKVRHAEATARRFQILRAPAPVDDIFALLRSAVPATLPRQIRDDVIGKMALEIFEGKLRPADIGRRVREYVAAQFREFSNFGRVSLDARLYDDGNATLLDRLSTEACTGYWDINMMASSGRRK